MDVRDRIPEAALGLLAESGAHELTQPKVSKAAGVRQSHLTYYFPTRADLLQEAARYSVEKLVGQLAAAPDHSPSRVAEAIAAGAADKRRVRVILGLVMAADRDPAIKKRMRKFADARARGASHAGARCTRTAARTRRACPSGERLNSRATPKSR